MLMAMHGRRVGDGWREVGELCTWRTWRGFKAGKGKPCLTKLEAASGGAAASVGKGRATDVVYLEFHEASLGMLQRDLHQGLE